MSRRAAAAALPLFDAVSLCPPRPPLRVVSPAEAPAVAAVPVVARRRPCPLMAERVSAYLARGATVEREPDGWFALRTPRGQAIHMRPDEAALYGVAEGV